MKTNLNSKTFRIAAVAGLISLVLSATSSTAQTSPEMQTMPNNTMSESMTPEQMRQQQQQMMGQMQQRMGQMDNMMMQDNSMRGGFGMQQMNEQMAE